MSGDWVFDVTFIVILRIAELSMVDIVSLRIRTRTRIYAQWMVCELWYFIAVV